MEFTKEEEHVLFFSASMFFSNGQSLILDGRHVDC